MLCITIPDFKLYYKAVIMKTVRYWHKNRHINQWNRIQPRNKPMLIWSINLWQRRIYNGEKTVFSKNGAGKNWTATCKRIKLDHFLTPYTKINSKQIEDLNVRSQTIKIVEKNTGSNFFGIGNICPEMSPQARKQKQK